MQMALWMGDREKERGNFNLDESCAVCAMKLMRFSSCLKNVHSRRRCRRVTRGVAVMDVLTRYVHVWGYSAFYPNIHTHIASQVQYCSASARNVDLFFCTFTWVSKVEWEMTFFWQHCLCACMYVGSGLQPSSQTEQSLLSISKQRAQYVDSIVRRANLLLRHVYDGNKLNIAESVFFVRLAIPEINNSILLFIVIMS